MKPPPDFDNLPRLIAGERFFFRRIPHRIIRDVAIVLMPMFVVLLIVIFFPELILALPKLLMAKFI